MKIIADTHAHTLVSGHAYSTIREMAQAGAEQGLKALALTEHAPEMPGTCGLYYFQNLNVVPREISGIQILFGAELNIMDTAGTVDLPESLYKKLDIVIASLHVPCYGEGGTIEENTRACIEAMKKPYINILGHPDDGRIPLDYEVLVKAAKETGTLLEVNNSSMTEDSFRQHAVENIEEMLKFCKRYGVCITTGSDAHVDVAAGVFGNVQNILEKCGFPEELVVTTDFEKLKPHLNLYRAL